MSNKDCPKADPCPGCGSHRIVMTVLLRENAKRTYFIRCLDCGYTTKEQETEYLACKKWNER